MDWSAQETLVRMYQELVERGEAIPPALRAVQALPGAHCLHPQQGRLPVNIDRTALSGVSCVYASADVNSLIATLGIDTVAHRYVSPLVMAYQNKGLVWGFSGYATPGYRYIREAHGIRALFGCLLTLGKTPSLVSDGGVSTGVPGLASVLAARSKVPIPTMGFIPREGLASIGPRTYLVVYGHTYAHREVMVATTPDVLVCVGGDQGTQRECEMALQAGGVVLLLALKQYEGATALTNTYRYSPALRQALANGRLVVCNDLSALSVCVKQIVRTAETASVASRLDRLRALDQYLSY